MEEKPFSDQSLSSNPLFSFIITLYILILLYFPHIFFTIISSPVPISTAILLFTLLRFGATQITEKQNSEKQSIDKQSNDKQSISTESEQDDKWVWSEPELKPESEVGFKPLFVDSFLEWDVRAPLEVIYEEEEEDEEEENEKERLNLQRYPSLSLYYPESDSETSSDGDSSVIGEWDSPENICFRWDEEDDKEGLIEIALDGKRVSEFHGEEENMIEIDIFPGRFGGVYPVSLSVNSD